MDDDVDFGIDDDVENNVDDGEIDNDVDDDVLDDVLDDEVNYSVDDDMMQSGKPGTIRDRIKPPVYVSCITHSTMYEKTIFC